jgi:hypothetical protein
MLHCGTRCTTCHATPDPRLLAEKGRVGGMDSRPSFRGIGLGSKYIRRFYGSLGCLGPFVPPFPGPSNGMPLFGPDKVNAVVLGMSNGENKYLSSG